MLINLSINAVNIQFNFQLRILVTSFFRIMCYFKFLYFYRKFSSYVPEYVPLCQSDLEKLKRFLTSYKNFLALTGAGISTESGIPDYRSKDVGLYARSNHKPMTYQEFVKSNKARQRYWARSFVGWPKFSSVSPNSTHLALCTLERHQIIPLTVTQNVDNLLYKAGCRNVIELHGTLYRVTCVSCNNYFIDRHRFQNQLEKINPQNVSTPEMIRPDGDVDLHEEYIENFKIPSCPKCNGFLKPDVTFFGENIPAKRVQLVKNAVGQFDAILVLGSTLSVFSAYRIILQAVALQKPICIVNIGPTRADEYASLKLDAKCGDVVETMLSICYH